MLLVGKVSAEDGDQSCHPGDNITDLKNFRKPTLDFKADFWPFVTTPISNKLFGRPKMPELGTTHCHPFTEDLTNLLMDECQKIFFLTFFWFVIQFRIIKKIFQIFFSLFQKIIF